MSSGLELVETAVTLSGHNGKVWSVSWNPHPFNGAHQMVASSGEDGVILWHLYNAKWSIFKRLENKGGMSVNCCAWHPDGKILATGGSNFKITIWEYKQDSFESVEEMNVPWNQKIKSLAWNKDGIYLLCCTQNGVISIITKKNDRYMKNYSEPLRVNVPISCGIWHPSENHFAIAGYKNITIYEAKEKQLVGNNVEVTAICKIDKSDNLQRHYHSGTVNSISYSQTGRIITAGTDTNLNCWQYDEKQWKLDLTAPVRTGPRKLLPSFKWKQKHDAPIMCTDWSICGDQPSQNLIAIGCLRGTISLYFEKHQDTGYEVFKKVSAHEGPINDLKWHPKASRILASASSDGKIRIWETRGELPVSGRKLPLPSSYIDQYDKKLKRRPGVSADS